MSIRVWAIVGGTYVPPEQNPPYAHGRPAQFFGPRVGIMPDPNEFIPGDVIDFTFVPGGQGGRSRLVCADLPMSGELR